MLSKVIGVYRIASDIELRYLPSGSAVAKVNLVNSSKYKTQTGEQKEDVCFIKGTVFGKQAEIINQYCHKGSKIYVIGELKHESWTDQQGTKRSTHSIKIDSFEFLDSKPNNTQTNQAPNQGYQQPNANVPTQTFQTNPQGYQQQNSIPSVDINDDEIPF